MRKLKIVLALSLMAGVMTTAQGQSGANSAVGQAKQAVNTAQQGVTTAKTALEGARAKVLESFRVQNPDYAKAEADLAKAKADMEAAKGAAENAMRSRPEYKKVADGKALLLAKYRELQEQKAPASQLNEVLAAYTKYADALNKLDRQAVDADPRYAEAKARLTDSQRIVDNFKAAIEAAGMQDPAYAASFQAFQAAQTQLATAQEQLKSTMMSARPAKSGSSSSSKGCGGGCGGGGC